jgi:hypothetical protein
MNPKELTTFVALIFAIVLLCISAQCKDVAYVVIVHRTLQPPPGYSTITNGKVHKWIHNGIKNAPYPDNLSYFTNEEYPTQKKAMAAAWVDYDVAQTLQRQMEEITK